MGAIYIIQCYISHVLYIFSNNLRTHIYVVICNDFSTFYSVTMYLYAYHFYFLRYNEKEKKSNSRMAEACGGNKYKHFNRHKLNPNKLLFGCSSERREWYSSIAFQNCCFRWLERFVPGSVTLEQVNERCVLLENEQKLWPKSFWTCWWVELWSVSLTRTFYGTVLRKNKHRA